MPQPQIPHLILCTTSLYHKCICAAWTCYIYMFAGWSSSVHFILFLKLIFPRGSPYTCRHIYLQVIKLLIDCLLHWVWASQFVRFVELVFFYTGYITFSHNLIYQAQYIVITISYIVSFFTCRLFFEAKLVVILNAAVEQSYFTLALEW